MGFGVKNIVDIEDYWKDLRPPLFKVRVLYLRPPQNVLWVGLLESPGEEVQAEGYLRQEVLISSLACVVTAWVACDPGFTVRYLGLFNHNAGGLLLYTAPVTPSTLLAGDTLSVTLRIDGLGGADNYVQVYDLLEQLRRQVSASTHTIPA